MNLADQLLIAIPTRGRVGRQTTLQDLRDTQAMQAVRLVVPLDEATAHGDLPVMVCPWSGIAATRQWVLDTATQPYVCFLSDDIFFARRIAGLTDKGNPKVDKCTPADMDAMFTTLLGWLRDEGFAHVGIGRKNLIHTMQEVEEVTRMNDAYAYDVAQVQAVGARFDRQPLMEDYDMTLQLLRAGLPNRVTYHWCWDQRGSNQAGGCSDYRTAAMQAQCARQLAAAHPGLVTVVERTAKTGWDGMQERLDVRVAWKKAYAQAGQATLL